MAQSKKRKKKYQPKDYRVNHFEIMRYIEPVQTFINQVKTDSVYFDDMDEALISLPGLEIEQLAAQGRRPFSAVYNLQVFSEVTYQTVIFMQDDENYIHNIIDIVIKFDKLFIEPLRLNEPMKQAGVDAAQAYVNASKALLFKIKIRQFHTVLHNIVRAVEQANDIVTNYDMREWLINYFRKTNSQKIKYLLE